MPTFCKLPCSEYLAHPVSNTVPVRISRETSHTFFTFSTSSPSLAAMHKLVDSFDNDLTPLLIYLLSVHCHEYRLCCQVLSLDFRTFSTSLLHWRVNHLLASL